MRCSAAVMPSSASWAVRRKLPRSRAQGGSLDVHHDVRVYADVFAGAESNTLDIPETRHAYAHVAREAFWSTGCRLKAKAEPAYERKADSLSRTASAQSC